MDKVVHIAGVVIRDEKGRYLLVQEAKQRVHGLWNWPAGHVDEGESLHDAAIREAFEETSYRVKIIDPRAIYESSGDAGTQHYLHLYAARVLDGRLKFQPGELLDARWFTVPEIEKMHEKKMTRGDWVRGGMKRREELDENNRN